VRGGRKEAITQRKEDRNSPKKGKKEIKWRQRHTKTAMSRERQAVRSKEKPRKNSIYADISRQRLIL
jgi:hypothetical protein